MVWTKGDEMKVLLRFVLVWVLLGIGAFSWGQLPDSVLFTVNGRPVTARQVPQAVSQVVFDGQGGL